MSLANLQHTLNRELAKDLREILHAPGVKSLEPECDRLPVSRGLIQGMAEALDLADRRITSLETMAGALAKSLRELLQHMPWNTQPSLTHVLDVLTKVEEIVE